MLETARRATVEGAPVGIELLFTVSEENALAGAKAFAVDRLESRLRLRLRPRHTHRRDQCSRRPPTIASPRSSTAPRRMPASAPRTGATRSPRRRMPSSAMQLGRLDPDTTTNKTN